ncbi:MAG: hypothetical protein HY319_32895 [Armatimonadetes bacterium]|nr:hypothetical protein [Armatimonadota bacterium]
MRGPPAEVPPLIHAGVRYIAPPWGFTAGRQQNGGYVEALDESTNTRLWELRVYTLDYDPGTEGDVQDVFISSLAMGDGVLVVTDERGREYHVDLATRQVQEVTTLLGRLSRLTEIDARDRHLDQPELMERYCLRYEEAAKLLDSESVPLSLDREFAIYHMAGRAGEASAIARAMMELGFPLYEDYLLAKSEEPALSRPERAAREALIELGPAGREALRAPMKAIYQGLHVRQGRLDPAARSALGSLLDRLEPVAQKAPLLQMARDVGTGIAGDLDSPGGFMARSPRVTASRLRRWLVKLATMLGPN